MINTMKKLADIATELGGTTYEIAESGGLLSAVNFLKIHGKGRKGQLPKNVKVISEAYVRFDWEEEMDRIFLYKDNMQNWEELMEKGSIEKGKLIIPYDRLKEVADMGYRCLYRRSPDGHNGKSFVRYHAVFGENKIMIPFKMWNSSAYFEGNGCNVALLVTTKYEISLVMPDIHAVQESIRVVRGENHIREKYDACFRIERMRLKGEKGSCPEAYERLHRQVTYIKTKYPEVYEEVWNREKAKGSGKEKVSLGICMEVYRTLAVCRMPDSTMRKVPNMESSFKMTVPEKYYFGGHGDILQMDSAIENVPAIIRNIIASAEITYKVEVDKIYITVRNNALAASQMLCAVASDSTFPEIEFVDYYTAVMNAYGENGDLALFCEFNDCRFAPAIIRKCEDNTYKMVHRLEDEIPEDDIFREDDDYSYVYENTFQEVYEDEWGEPMVPGLREIMWSDMDHFMLDAGLRELGIDDRRAADKKALKDIRFDWERVKRQFARNNDAKIMFNNGYLSITVDYPIDRLEKCFALILRNCDATFKRLLEEADISQDELSAVLLAGEDSEYPFVQEHFAQLTGKEVKVVNMAEYAVARGALLHK